MKSILFGLMLSAALLYSHAEEEVKPKEGDIKIYKRLIPADVLRGKFRRVKDYGNVRIQVMYLMCSSTITKIKQIEALNFVSLLFFGRFWRFMRDV